MESKNTLDEKEFLNTYNKDGYDRPSVSVDALIFTVTDKESMNYRKPSEKELKILMVQREKYPYKDKWAIVGGFIKMDEDLDNGAQRVLKEKTNVDNIYMEQLYTFGDVRRDPRMRILSCSYMSLVDSSLLNIKAGRDTEDIRLFKVNVDLIKKNTEFINNGYITEEIYLLTLVNDDNDEIIKLSSKIKKTTTRIDKNKKVKMNVIKDENDIAFDHAQIILYGFERLVNKVEYTDIIFNLMPETFTLLELENVYEIFLGKNAFGSRTNFQRKIGNKIIETENLSRGKGFNTARLFSFNTKWEL